MYGTLDLMWACRVGRTRGKHDFRERGLVIPNERAALRMARDIGWRALPPATVVVLALLFWALTFFGSIYLGYHYAVDAPVAAVVAVGCWIMARKLFGRTREGAYND